MKLHPNYRLWIAATVLVMAILACIGPGVQTVPTQTPQAQPTPGSQNSGTSPTDEAAIRANLIKATVQIYALKMQNGELTPIYSGSGTIISPTGMILTNAHVASPASRGKPENEPDVLAIGLTNKQDQAPEFLYTAKLQAVDGKLDLAVIQIATTLDGAEIDPSTLSLPYVKLGNSDDLLIGDHINVFGFPGIGGETITFTGGSVSGFSSQQDIGDRAWIKTDAVIAGGNSGGLAASDAGTIIGVPSIAASGGSGDITDCRVVQDTNGDGVLDSRDTCVPIGGFINGIRPINFALPLIQAVKVGQAYVSPYGGNSQSTAQGGGNESFGAVTWLSATNDCQAQVPVDVFPSGTIAMAAGFSFQGMTDGEPWAQKWTVDGQELYSNQDVWSFGQQGDTSTCLYNTDGGMPEGSYHLELYAGKNLDLLTQADVVVGTASNNGQNQSSGQGQVSVSGHVVDADSSNPIPGAEIYVLKANFTFANWKDDGYADKDIFSYAKADNQGFYSLPDKLSQDVGYTFIMFVDGYSVNYADNLVWTSSDPLNYQLDLSMSK
jgi:serine protease Do